VRFAEVRIVKELADGGRLVGWIAVSPFQKEKFLPQRAQRTRRRNGEGTADEGIGVRDQGRIWVRVVRASECLPVSPPFAETG
jgi:hypothetical protein